MSLPNEKDLLHPSVFLNCDTPLLSSSTEQSILQSILDDIKNNHTTRLIDWPDGRGIAFVTDSLSGDVATQALLGACSELAEWIIEVPTRRAARLMNLAIQECVAAGFVRQALLYTGISLIQSPINSPWFEFVRDATECPSSTNALMLGNSLCAGSLMDINIAGIPLTAVTVNGFFRLGAVATSIEKVLPQATECLDNITESSAATISDIFIAVMPELSLFGCSSKGSYRGLAESNMEHAKIDGVEFKEDYLDVDEFYGEDSDYFASR